jgi:hypothetical protein
MVLFEDQEVYDIDLLADDMLEILEIFALNWMGIAERMVGDGSRGPYSSFTSSCVVSRIKAVSMRTLMRISRELTADDTGRPA